jgi:hypothetical protein
MADADDAPQDTDRRGRQRFVAKRRGEDCFWALIDGRREALTDLSLEGFSVASRMDGTDAFALLLHRAGVPDEIVATARLANSFETAEGVQSGCRFESFEGDGHERLRDWLVAHVIANASVPISEKDAERIVSGPSLI